ncbi:nuclear transport factor 2 family protein [Zobellella sp. An-6]|uniref:nuclear transport factor 2 family protein n=1 Tax=Zobellella sp. An-6 TaxID=3400218 RepID=UPI004041546E
MTVQLPIVDFSQEQRELWEHVTDLWVLAQRRDEGRIRSTLHPEYVGWDMTALLPHDRDAAVLSISGDSPELREYELHPLSVQVYEGKVGIVHYSYSAMVVPQGAEPINVTGRWSEVYLKQDGTWTMISVSGRPDVSEGGDRAESA